MSQALLEKHANVLDAAATYIEELEAQNQRFSDEKTAQETVRVTEEAAALATNYKNATGDDLDVKTAEKIVRSDDEDVRTLFKKLASFEEADSMGSAHTTKKVASENPEDDRFVNWALS